MSLAQTSRRLASTSSAAFQPLAGPSQRPGVPIFYTNKAVEAFAAKPSTPISLKHLIYFGLSGRNQSEKQEADKLMKGGNFLRTELPTRLAHRLRDLQSLPLSTMSHPRLQQVYQLYLEAFEAVRKVPQIRTLEDNDAFCNFMQSTLDKHRAVIPALAIGISESSPLHLRPATLDAFMTRMLRSRISRRVVTSQHIALTTQFRARQGKGKALVAQEGMDNMVGVVETKLTAEKVVKRCVEMLRRRGGVEVPVVMEGAKDVEFAYIAEHLEFMILQLLKNATEATVNTHGPKEATQRPITVTVVHGSRDLLVRISDQGGGLAPYGGLPPIIAPVHDTGLFLPPHAPAPQPTAALVPKNVTLTCERLDVFSFSHMRRAHLALQAHQQSTSAAAPDQDSDALKGIMALRKVAGQDADAEVVVRTKGDGKLGEEGEDVLDAQMNSGIGLPLAKMFAEYFSGPAEAPGTGSLAIWTVQGFGSSATVSIPKFGHAS